MQTPACPARPILLGALVALSAALGCSDSKEQSPDPQQQLPFEDVSLTFSVPAGFDLTAQWGPAINDWADENSATVDLVETDYDRDGSGWLAELKERSPALVLLPTTLLGDLVAADFVATVPEENLDGEVTSWHRIPQGIRSSLAHLGSAPAIVPVTYPTPVAAYRADLLDAAGRHAPKTWEEFDELVRDVDEWAPGLVAVLPLANGALVTMFLSRAVSGAQHPAQYSVELDAIDGSPLIARPPFVSALGALKALQPTLAADARQMTPDDCCRALMDGTAAIGIFWEMPSMRADEKQARATGAERGPLTFTPLPGQTSVFNHDSQEWESATGGDVHRTGLCGFSGYSVCTLALVSDLDRSAAWDLWGLLEAYQAEGTIRSLPGVSLAEFGAASSIPGLTPREQQLYDEAVRISLQNPSQVCALPLPQRSLFEEELLRAAQRVLEGEATPAEALEAAAAQWSVTIESLGRDSVVNCYRQRLGLTPLAE